MGKRRNHGPRRFLIAPAVDAEAADRPGSSSGHPDGARARALVVDLFTNELGYVLVRVPEPTPVREGLPGRLIRSTSGWDRRPDDIVAVHLAGPGGLLGGSPGRHVFFTADEVPGRPRPAISTARILDALVEGAGIGQLLLLADTFASDASFCDATALSAATERLSRDLGHPDGLAVIGALQPTGMAAGAGFAELFAAAVRAMSRTGTRPSVLDLRAVLAHIEADPRRSPALCLAWAGGPGRLPAFVSEPRRAPGGAADANRRPPPSIGADRAESADPVGSQPESPDPGSASAGSHPPESVERADPPRDLIRPLLHAQGHGLPWEDVWPELASRLAGHRYTDADIAELIDRPPGEHVRIVETTVVERSYYRVDFLASDGPVPAYRDEDVDDAEIHTAFVRTLMSRVPYRSDGGRDWARAHPYTLRYLATHARNAGLLDEIVLDAEYLVHAHPSTLNPHLPTVRTPAARVAAAVYRASIGVHRTVGSTTRRRILALDALCIDAAPLAAALVAGIAPDAWKPLAATGGSVTPAALDTIRGQAGSVDAVVCATLDGRPVAVTASRDKSVRVRDLATGRSVGPPIAHEALAGRSHRTNALACTTLDGRVVVVGGSWDTAVRMWDLRTARLVREPFLGHEDSVTAVACTVLDGRPVAVTGSADQTVRVWDPHGPAPGHAVVLRRPRALRTPRPGPPGRPRRLLASQVADDPPAPRGSARHRGRPRDIDEVTSIHQVVRAAGPDIHLGRDVGRRRR
ncbi:hypothetical protein [Embleya scabrispora]|uniref:hypothetical protein n=1 Tax=Embleya scabrispora TaxID=159449 RepID=UPI0003A69694|nr:hypothetical protein [Embleya scabrispora]MYS86580.1 hypothetical protein [Streptomyces sp. SID5474]